MRSAIYFVRIIISYVHAAAGLLMWVCSVDLSLQYSDFS
ncbi:hypothetical protein PRUB_a5134 [Pseudoalteromonas rubra]|uniref:Uncharacterized protein n=1 Tax=Pseudoalteromonas rubra TaxID=43658 RepID=A0A8T0C5E1_9GAMM|nr:hypothetical protein PRUB_a5134 [Pseudoalteromonas rubra]